MDLRKKIILLAYENPDMRDDLLPLIRKHAVKPSKELMVEHWELWRVEDSWEEGEIGRSQSVNSGKGDGRRYGDIKSLANNFAGGLAPNSKDVWDKDGWDDGRIEATWLGNDYGDELDRKDKEKWRAGEIKAYTYRLDVWVSVVDAIST